MSQIQIRRDTEANWTAVNPVLSSGELGWDTSNKSLKIGDGSTQWNSLSRQLNPRIGTVTSSAAPTPDADAHDQYNVTALAVTAVFGAPLGTPFDGQRLVIRVKDNGTARALSFNTVYRAIGTTLPTTTAISRVLYLGCLYNVQDTTWDVLAVGQL